MAFDLQIIGIVGVVLGAILGFLYAKHLWKRKAELLKETLRVILYCDQHILRKIKHCRPDYYENSCPNRDLALGLILEEIGILDKYEHYHRGIEGYIKLRGSASLIYNDLKRIDDILLSKIPKHIKVLYGSDVHNLRLNLLNDYMIRGRKLVYRVENDVSEDERIKHSLFQTVLNEKHKMYPYYEQQEVEFNPNDLKNICQKDKKNVSKEDFERLVQNQAVELFQEHSDYINVGILNNMSDTERAKLVDEYINYSKCFFEDMSPSKLAKTLSILVSFKRDKQKMIHSYLKDEDKDGTGVEYLRSFMLGKFCEGQEANENFELLKDYVKNKLLNDEVISLNDFLKHP